MPTEARWTMAVAAVMPTSTSRTRYRAANVIAISWLLSPSSATKITAVLSRTAYIRDRVLSGLAGGHLADPGRPFDQARPMKGRLLGRKSRPPPRWPVAPGPRASMSTRLLGSPPLQLLRYREPGYGPTTDVPRAPV